MASFNLHKVTANSWIANTNGNPIAYIYRKEDKYVYMTQDGGKQEFDKMQDIKEFLGGRVKEQITEASSGLDSEVQETIEGFPVKHANISVEQAGDRPVYVRGKTQHVAGYWCIKFSKRWVPSFCPLLKTVEQYQSAGPFKNRLEMMSNLSSMNRQLGA